MSRERDIESALETCVSEKHAQKMFLMGANHLTALAIDDDHFTVACRLYMSQCQDARTRSDYPHLVVVYICVLGRCYDCFDLPEAAEETGCL